MASEIRDTPSALEATDAAVRVEAPGVVPAAQVSDVASALEALARSPVGAALLDVLRTQIATRGMARAAAAEDSDRTVVSRYRNRSVSSLFKALADKPQRYELFAAMRLLENLDDGKPRLGRSKRPKDDVVRFTQNVSLSFAASSIHRFVPAEGDVPPRLEQNVLGLFGSNGPLPLHLTDYARGRMRNRDDPTFARFADVFHHRMLSLFYRAWAVAQPVVNLDRPMEDRFGDYIGALCGLGSPALRKRDSVDDHVKLAHAGVLARHVKSAEGLQVMLSNYFSVEVAIEQWVGNWLPIPAGQRTRIGKAPGFSQLGQDAVLGNRVWDSTTKFTIVLGPLSYADYQRFLPTGRSYSRMRDLVRLYIGHELAWQVRLVLRHSEVPYAWLGNSVWLGWSSWLGVRIEETDARDLDLVVRDFHLDHGGTPVSHQAGRNHAAARV